MSFEQLEEYEQLRSAPEGTWPQAVIASMKSETASREIGSGMSVFVEIGISLNTDAGE